MNATKVVMHVGASADHDLDAENVAVAPDTTIYDAQGREVGIARTLGSVPITAIEFDVGL
jgi:hypothetical protein